MTTAATLLIGSGLLVTWIFRWNRRVLHELAIHSMSVIDSMLSDEDEEVKLGRVEKSTGKLLRSLLAFVILLAIVGCILLGPILLVEGSTEMLLHWQGMLALSVGSMAGYFYPRSMNARGNKRAANSSHSELNQLIHRMILNHPYAHRRLMNREVRAWKKRGGVSKPNFVWITGLARSGTTSMLERLVASNHVHSLTYANMPMVLAPGLWKKVYKPKTGEKRERSHGDGIFIGVDSAEALEEVFFQAMTGREFIAEDALEYHDISNELHEAYLDYQGIALASHGHDRAVYIAKNNNAMLRYRSMREKNRDFHVILMFREPLSHAASLLAMHQRYCDMQSQDPFVKEYMDWLAHHEFGLGQKPYRFTTTTNLPAGNPMELDYWLESWINHYQEALDMDDHHVHFVPYEVYCERPDEVLSHVVQKCGIHPLTASYKPFKNKRRAEGNVNPERLEQANQLYHKLLEKVKL